MSFQKSGRQRTPAPAVSIAVAVKYADKARSRDVRVYAILYLHAYQPACSNYANIHVLNHMQRNLAQCTNADFFSTTSNACKHNVILHIIPPSYCQSTFHSQYDLEHARLFSAVSRNVQSCCSAKAVTHTLLLASAYMSYITAFVQVIRFAPSRTSIRTVYGSLLARKSP